LKQKQFAATLGLPDILKTSEQLEKQLLTDWGLKTYYKAQEL